MGFFAPFKSYFKRYRDASSVSNKGKCASKQTLAIWVLKALERAFTARNITAGFRTIGIYPLNCEAVNAHMGLARQFASLPSTVQQGVNLEGRVGSGAKGATKTLSREGRCRFCSHEDGDSGSDYGGSGSSDRVL